MNDIAAGSAEDTRARALAHLQNIGVRALESNLRRVAELDQAVSTMARGELSEQQRNAAVDTAHQLVGSAGTFGYAAVSDAARRLERFFIAGGQSGDLNVGEAAEELLQMRRDLDSGPDDPDDD